jgi:adenylate kinase
MFMARLAELPPGQGFILDGFPRTLPQAQALDTALAKLSKAIDIAVNITGPDDVLIDRLLGRAKDSGRADDTPEAIKKRLEVQKPPSELLDHYRRSGKLKDVDGLPEIPVVTAAVLAVLDGQAVK